MNDNYLDESSEYHARDIEIVDSIGRQHKCLFKIFSVMPDYIYCTFFINIFGVISFEK